MLQADSVRGYSLLSLPPQTAKGLCMGQENLLILDPLALVTHLFHSFIKSLKHHVWNMRSIL